MWMGKLGENIYVKHAADFYLFIFGLSVIHEILNYSCKHKNHVFCTSVSVYNEDCSLSKTQDFIFKTSFLLIIDIFEEKMLHVDLFHNWK